MERQAPAQPDLGEDQCFGHIGENAGGERRSGVLAGLFSLEGSKGKTYEYEPVAYGPAFAIDVKARQDLLTEEEKVAPGKSVDGYVYFLPDADDTDLSLVLDTPVGKRYVAPLASTSEVTAPGALGHASSSQAWALRFAEDYDAIRAALVTVNDAADDVSLTAMANGCLVLLEKISVAEPHAVPDATVDRPWRQALTYLRTGAEACATGEITGMTLFTEYVSLSSDPLAEATEAVMTAVGQVG